MIGICTSIAVSGCGSGHDDGDSSTGQPPSTNTPSGDIIVDAAVTTGSASPLFGLGLQVNSGNITLADFTRVGCFRLDLGWSVLSQATSLADVQARLTALHPEDMIREITARGGNVTINLLMMPGYLSSQPSDHAIDPGSGWEHRHAAPPTDLAAWAQLVETVVSYFSVTNHLDVRYEIWNEPDSASFWRGTPNEYLALYRASVLGARRALPTALIGGPVLGSLEVGSTTMPITDGWMRGFITACATTTIPELGLTRLPIDFLVWHDFGTIPHWAGQRIPEVRTWLRDAGYPSSTTLVIDEWNINLEGQPAAFVNAPLSDSASGASSAVANLFAYQQRGLDVHAYSALGDWSAGPGEFHGGQGIVTTSGIRKPVYRAFQCASHLTGSALALSTTYPSPFVTARATRSAYEVALVIVNHVPHPRLAYEQAVGYHVATSAVADELRMLSSSILDQVYQETLDPASLALSPAARSALRSGQQEAHDVRTWAATTATVQIALTSLPVDFTHERIYAVDETHANSQSAYHAAVNSGTTPEAAAATARAHDELLLIAERSRPPGTTNVTVHLEPHAVWLITYDASPIASPAIGQQRPVADGATAQLARHGKTP